MRLYASADNTFFSKRVEIHNTINESVVIVFMSDCRVRWILHIQRTMGKASSFQIHYAVPMYVSGY